MAKTRQQNPEQEQLLETEQEQEQETQPEGTYTTAQVCSLVGISQSVLSTWQGFGVIRPSVRKAIQGGKTALWSEQDVAWIKECRDTVDLIRAKFTVEAILRAKVLKNTPTKEQALVLTAAGPRIIDRTMPIGQVRRLNPDPIILF